MSIKDLTQATRAYLKELTGAATLENDDDLFAPGRLTSLKALALVQWLEQTFEISVQGTDLSLDNLGTLDAIVRFVVTKQSALAAA